MSGEISPHWTLKRGCFILEIHAPVLFSPSPSHAPALSHVVFSLPSCSHCHTRHRRQGRTEHFPCGPSSGGSPRCQSFSTLARALGHHVAISLARLHERYSP